MKTILTKQFVLIVILVLSIGSISQAQQIPQLSSGNSNSGKALRTVKSNTNVEYLRDLSQKLKNRSDSLRSLALELAKEKGWMTSKRLKDGTVIELISVTPNGQPLYYKTDNVDAARTTSTDRVQPGGDLGLNLSGAGMIIGEWDGGDALLSHNEFNNTGSSRITDMDGFWELSNHATHVAGTLIGGGAEPDALGMAYDAELQAYDWFDDNSEVASAAAGGLLVSNHSYGFATGWTYLSDTDEWFWFGDPFVSEEEDYRFGFYSYEAFLLDDIAYNAPYYLYVKSAGNDRGDWDGFSDIPPDGGDEGFDCIGGQGNAKNVLTVGAIFDIPDGYNSTSDVVDASFSSMGPTDDGRIKPDIVGNGIGLFSSLAGSDDDYASYSGTSMAAPNVAGSLILLQEHYENLYAEYMRSATLKALIIATADEAGPDPGPDYKFGWGVLNTATAANTITTKGQETRIQEETYSSTTTTFVVTASGNEPLTATMVWTDIVDDTPDISLDPTDIILVNDLNLAVTSDGVTSFPYKLSGSNPSAAATTGINNVDNVEKVFVENPVAGAEYTIEISHSGSIQGQFGSQDYSLVVTGLISAVSDLRLDKVYGLHQTGQASGDLLPRYYADIVNSGDFPSNGGTIELEATGDNAGMANGIFGSLDPMETAFASITGYAPQNVGTSTITMALPDDGINGNNTGMLTQETTEGTYSYSNDDPPLNSSVGFGEGEGALLAKYPISGSRTLTDIRVHLRSQPGNTIRAVVMDTLGNILAHGDEYIIQSEDIGEWVTLSLTTNADVTDAIVYAGIELYQGPEDWFPMGVQEEVPAHPDAYYSGAIGGGEPVLGPYRELDKWMIELTTCKILPDDLSLSGSEIICEGESSEFIAEFGGDSDIEWTLPEGWEGVVNGNSITVTPDENNGTLTVTAFNECNVGNPVSVDVSVQAPQESSFSVELCQGESYTFPDGTSEDNIQEDFSYTSDLQSILGCDSTVVTEILVYTVELGFESVNVCSGESVTFPDGTSENNIQDDFSYASIVESVMGCDSTVVTNVEVYVVEDGFESVNICSGENVTFPDGTIENNIEADFSYSSLIESVMGCDSTIITNVEVYAVEDGFESITICIGESVTFPDGSIQENVQSDLTYTSDILSAQGCDSIVVTDVDVSSIENNLIAQEGNTLSAIENMETYSWLLCVIGSTQELGENGMTFSPEADGNYAVQVTNSFGCSSTSDCYPFILNSVNGTSGQSTVNVFPNPSNGDLTITGMPLSRYQLFDIHGRLVQDGLIPSPSNEVKLVFSEIPASLYLLRLFTENGYEDVRVIFE